MNGSVRVSAAPEAEAGARPLSGCRWLWKSPFRLAQGTGSPGRGGTWPGPLVAAKYRDLCTCSGEAEVGSEGMGLGRWWRDGEGLGHRTGLHQLPGWRHLCRGCPAVSVRTIGRPQSGDSMLKPGSPPFRSLGGLGSHIADSPIERGPPILSLQASPQPQALPAAGGSHMTPQAPHPPC